MCLAVPARLTERRPNEVGIVEIGGVTREVNLSLIDEEVSVGDYVIVHVGFALSKLDPAEAEETLRLLGEMGALEPAGEDDA